MVFRLFRCFVLFFFFVVFFLSALTRYTNKELVKLVTNFFIKIMFPAYTRPERGLTSIPLQFKMVVNRV